MCIIKHGLHIRTYMRSKYADAERMRNEMAAKGTDNMTGINKSIACDFTDIS